MDTATLNQILQSVRDGSCPVEEATRRLQNFTSEQLDHTVVDHHRTLRTGIPEVVFGEAKSSGQIIDIVRTMQKRLPPILVTRVDAEKAERIREEVPELHYHRDARMLIRRGNAPLAPERTGKVLIVCAGTSDIPVAEEAFLTAETFGNPVEKLYDVGVAGLHRLLSQSELLTSARVIVVVAGMEGALPSVVAGLVRCPVIAVPTSVGYGASFGGIAALLGMLNSCAPGVAVVNIDNGFGAACMADAINRA